MKNLTFISALALGAAMLASGCSRGKNNAGGAGVPVLVVLAWRQTCRCKLIRRRSSCNAVSTVTVHSQIGGHHQRGAFQGRR